MYKVLDIPIQRKQVCL